MKLGGHFSTPTEGERLRIAARLIDIRRTGLFDSLWIENTTIRIRWHSSEEPQFVGWGTARQMVALYELAGKPEEANARAAAAALCDLCGLAAGRKPPRSERARRAVIALVRKTTGRPA